MNLLEVVLPSVAAVIIGVITYLIAPKVHWVLEAKRMKFENRLALITEVRSELGKDKFDAIEFRESAAYSRIRTYLTPELIGIIESVGKHKLVIKMTGRGGGINNFKSRILDELAKLEQEWELV